MMALGFVEVCLKVVEKLFIKNRQLDPPTSEKKEIKLTRGVVVSQSE